MLKYSIIPDLASMITKISAGGEGGSTVGLEPPIGESWQET
jgi:hypothetical protein